MFCFPGEPAVRVRAQLGFEPRETTGKSLAVGESSMPIYGALVQTSGVGGGCTPALLPLVASPPGAHRRWGVAA